jgi:hypothetical protein
VERDQKFADVRFTEVRHAVTLGFAKDFTLGGDTLSLGIHPRLSAEPDYTSVGTSVTSALALADRATTLRLSLSYLHDTVGKILRGFDRADPTGRDLSDRGTIGELDALALTAGWEQVVTPTVTLALGYDLGYLRGYQANSYRLAVVGGIPIDERHPRVRHRHTLHGRLALYVPSTSTALHALYRAYVDTWDVAAVAPEARIYQELGDDVLLRVRYRFYSQTRASFVADGYDGDAPYYTADPKLDRFHSHLAGARLLLRLAFLDGTPLAFAAPATFALSVDHILSTSRPGNAVVAQATLRLPY